VKPALKLGVSQQLTLTPQLRQAIRLLQLSAVELEQEVLEALETNPLLERGESEGEDGEVVPENTPSSVDETPVTPDAPEAPEAPIEAKDAPDVDRSDDNWDDPETSDVDWDDIGPRSSGSGLDEEGDPLAHRTPAPESLHDYLTWQLNLTPITPRDRAIADALIDAIDEDGYLRESNDAIRSTLGELAANVGDDEIEAVRHRLQRFDPPGIASRTPSECLHTQLAEMDIDTPYRELALVLVREHLETLARDPAKLALRLHVSSEDLDGAIALVRTLNPRPGSNFGAPTTEYIVPDVYAYKAEGRWRVKLNPSCTPSLAINRHYERLAAASRDDTGNYLRAHLQEARWLNRSLRARGDTMLKVAACIVRQQGAFLDYGPEAMRPLTLREVADEIGVHESTVSRVTTRKYLHTPRGTFEFKHFFSVGLATSEGGEASATAIRAMIRKLVDDENPRKPMSDSAIAADLNRRGIAVARRTVAKYREAMNIPSSNDRCRLA
jgi:RNA polymerase sigma-54 factor